MIHDLAILMVFVFFRGQSCQRFGNRKLRPAIPVILGLVPRIPFTAGHEPQKGTSPIQPIELWRHEGP